MADMIWAISVRVRLRIFIFCSVCVMGKTKDAKIAMTATTMSNSMRVNAEVASSERREARRSGRTARNRGRLKSVFMGLAFSQLFFHSFAQPLFDHTLII